MSIEPPHPCFVGKGFVSLRSTDESPSGDGQMVTIDGERAVKRVGQPFECPPNSYCPASAIGRIEARLTLLRRGVEVRVRSKDEALIRAILDSVRIRD